MNDINSRIEKLNSYKKTNFYVLGINILYFLYLTLKSTLVPNTDGQWVILAYLFINLMVCIFFLFNFVKPKKNIDFPQQPEKYYEMQIDRSIIPNDFAPLLFFLPIFFSIMSVLAIDWLHDKPINGWSYLIMAIFLIPTLYLYVRMRKILRQEFKRIHGIDFLSFLYF